MAFAPTFSQGLGLVAATLIVLLGAFVLRAKPRSDLHRLFFAFALADGLSTGALALRDAFPGPAAVYMMFAHEVAFVASVVLLLALGLFFPRPLAPVAHRSQIWAALLGALVVAVALASLWPRWFWSAAPEGAIPSYHPEPAGHLALAAFGAIVAFMLVRLTLDLTRETSTSHRRQGSYVLGGLMLATVPPLFTSLVLSLRADPGQLAGPRVEVALASWGALLATLAMLVAAAVVSRWRGHGGDAERRFLLGCCGGVGLLTAITLAFPTTDVRLGAGSIALLAYPFCVALAIGRYEPLEVDVKLRRRMTVLGAAAALALVFLATSALVRGALGDRLGSLDLLVAVGAATLLTAALVVPARRIVDRAASRFAPPPDAVHRRRIEIYAHSLHGVYADGIVEVGESQTLHALRQSLGITDEEHERLVRAIVLPKPKSSP